MKKHLAVLLSVVLTLALLVSSAAVAEDLPKVLYFGQAYAGTALDMQISTNSGTASIADLVTESLIRFDDNNELQPILLTKLPDVSDDGLVYSFELKEGVYFTDGTELHS
ncbi:MAG: ABC transporter substrate-binding protein, partial [Clostridia bacterium]|nr:ABC transporter substrate-binding protein [Clostridia bacterium]